MKKGKFVVIEGGVGCGKSTQIELLKKKFPKWEYYREPGSTPFGEKIRDAVQGLHGYSVDCYASMFAYCAARANLIRGVILPLLKKGKTVILDRYWYTTYTYQGSAEGVPKKIIIDINKLAIDNLVPNLVIFYDLDPKIGMARKKGHKDTDRYDIKEIKFHEKARRGYKELGRMLPRIWKQIDASQSVDRVHSETLNLFKKCKIG